MPADPSIDVLYAITVYSAGADGAPVTQITEAAGVVGSPTARGVAVAAPVHGDSPTAATLIATESERPDALTSTMLVPPFRSARTSPVPSTLTSVGSDGVNVGTKSVTEFLNSSSSTDVIRAVSPTSHSLIASGFELMVASGPAVEVTSASMRFERPLTVAVRITAPVRVPSVTVVAAIPDASVVTDEGASTTPPPPDTVKFTTVPLTGRALASVTFTEKVPTEVVTAPLALGEVAMSIDDGGPIFGAEESDPQPASAASAKAASEKWRSRITEFSRSRAEGSPPLRSVHRA